MTSVATSPRYNRLYTMYLTDLEKLTFHATHVFQFVNKHIAIKL